MFRVTCNQCGASVMTGDGNSDLLNCPCCPQDHSHEAAANGCEGAGVGHGGEPCGLGVDGCTVCRPCTITVLGAAAGVPLVVR